MCRGYVGLGMSRKKKQIDTNNTFTELKTLMFLNYDFNVSDQWLHNWL